jgi:thiol-disulfide isomerase/thioredoxin
MRRVVGATLLVVLLSGLAACTGDGDDYDFNFPKPAKIDVDTPKLRELKKAAGVQPCRPGAESGASDLPEVTLPCFGGGPDVDLSSLSGPLVVNVWASWCGPCRAEMPALEEFHRRYGGRVGIIGINRQDPQSEQAMELVLETGVTYPLLSDPDDELLGAAPFPTSIPMPMFAFVSADGEVELASEPGIDSLDEVVDLVEQHTGVSL